MIEALKETAGRRGSPAAVHCERARPSMKRRGRRCTGEIHSRPCTRVTNLLYEQANNKLRLLFAHHRYDGEEGPSTVGIAMSACMYCDPHCSPFGRYLNRPFTEAARARP